MHAAAGRRSGVLARETDQLKGHVGFYVGEDAKGYYVLGGNQGDKVSVVRIAKDRLLPNGIRWPATVPVGTAAPRQMALGKGFSTYEA